MLNFTRGPWRWDGDSLWHFGEGYHDKDDPHIFTGILLWESRGVSETLQANARLVAAAPEMYEALKWLMHLAHGVSKGGYFPVTDEEWWEAKDSAIDALAKAEGRRE